MPRYRFAIEYLGTHYHGWQYQPGQPSVQQTLEEAFKICLRQEVKVVGSGRTDAGVHAKGQVAHIEYPGELDIHKTELSINHLTPPDVFIRSFQKAPPDFHARYSAQYREYRYRIIFRPSAFDYQSAWFCPYLLDADLFQAELKAIEGDHDFTAFSIPRNDGKSTRCHIHHTALKVKENSFEVTIRGNRFLHKMVRSIVGACYDVSRKKHPSGLTKSILQGTCKVERTWAPSEGLILKRVGYKDYEY